MTVPLPLPSVGAFYDVFLCDQSSFSYDFHVARGDSGKTAPGNSNSQHRHNNTALEEDGRWEIHEKVHVM